LERCSRCRAVAVAARLRLDDRERTNFAPALEPSLRRADFDAVSLGDIACGDDHAS